MDKNNTNNAQRLSAVMLDSLDDEAVSSNELARRAWQSRSGFFRLFQALIEETPGAMRRRLRLERAAWELRETRTSVTDIALNAGYGSLEAFTRAFRKAFHLSPSLFRRTHCARIHLPAPNDFHFRPSNSNQGGSKIMDLYDLFAGTDSWNMHRLLQHAAGLSDEQLDHPVKSTAKAFGWDKPDNNLREILERMVQTKEIWTAALSGKDMPNLFDSPAEERTPAALLNRFEKAEAEFSSIMRDIRDRGGWDETFVDRLCEPPETFTYGGMFAHVMTFNSYRRLVAMDAFHQLGINIQGSGCPIEYQEKLGARMT